MPRPPADPAPDDAPVRRRREEPAPRRRAAKGFGILGAVVVVALLAAVGYGAWSYFHVKRVGGLSLSDAVGSEPQNYLIVGSDSRAGVKKGSPGAGAMLGGETGGQRSDSISIARIDPGSDRIDMLSIPRDLWVPIGKSGKEQRINTAYAKSTQTLIDTIETQLDIPINHFVEVDFVGFQNLVSSLGGVPMYFDHPVRDRNSGLRITKAGCAVLDGYQGLAFARSRHLEWNNGKGWVSDPSGDLGRMTRQQLLARAALARTRSMGLDDAFKLKGLVDAALGSVTIDKSLGVNDVLGLGKRFSKFDPDRLQTHSIPVEGFRTSGGASVVSIKAAEAEPVLNIFRGTTKVAVTTTTTPPPKIEQVAVDIRNASGRDGQGRRVSYVLGGGGFQVGLVDSSTDLAAHSVVEYPKGNKAMAEVVAPFISPTPTFKQVKDLAPGHVRLVMGQDFAKVFTPSAKDLPKPSTTTTAPAASGSGSGSAAPAPPTTEAVVGWTPGVAPAGVVCR